MGGKGTVASLCSAPLLAKMVRLFFTFLSFYVGAVAKFVIKWVI